MTFEKKNANICMRRYAMIFNWKANSIKVLQTGEYSRGDKWERKKEYSQQLFLCAYLSSLGWSRERIFEKWKSIPNKDFENGSLGEDEYESRFKSVYERAMERKYSNSFTLDYDKEHVIYQEEIDAINALDATYVFRKYLFNLLCLEKFYRDAEGKFEITNDIRAYCFYHANNGKLYANSVGNMINSNIKAGRPLETFCIRGWVYGKLSFYRMNGTEALRFKDPSEIIGKSCDFIKEPCGICPKCGKVFVKNGYTKREICEDCYKKYRLKISRDYRKNKRKAPKKIFKTKRKIIKGNGKKRIARCGYTSKKEDSDE